MRRLGQQDSLTGIQYRVRGLEAISRLSGLSYAVRALPSTDSFIITEMFRQPVPLQEPPYGLILAGDAAELQKALDDVGEQFDEPVSSKAMSALTHLEKRLDELEAVYNETAPKEELPAPFPMVPVLMGAAGAFVLAEVAGITNVLGFRG